MTPLQLCEHLVALMPKSGVHLTRFFGVFVPRASERAHVVPRSGEPAKVAAPPKEEPGAAPALVYS